MRKNMMVLAGIVAFGISSATWVQADERAVSKNSAVSFRLASTSPMDGFQEMKAEDGETIYVSPRVTFTSDEVVSALHGQVRGDIDVSLTADALERVGRTNGELIAILANGKVTSTARLANVGRENVSISGLSDRELTRLSRVLGVGSAYGPVIRLVPQKTHAMPGDVVTVDAFVMGTQGLRTFQVGVDAIGGRTGKLVRETGSMDEARGDYVFGSSRAIKAVDDSRGRLGGTLWDGFVDAQDMSYMGSFSFRVSNDASGSFVFKVRMDEDSFLLDANGDPITFTPIHSTIKVGAGAPRSTR